MQLQLPFLTLTNSYVALLAHAFWPSDGGGVAPMDEDVGDEERYEEREKGQGLLDDSDDEA